MASIDWVLENFQAIVNWALAGGFTLTSVAEVIRTISQKRLNIKLDELSGSINSALTIVNNVRKVSDELLTTKKIFDSELTEVSDKIDKFLKNPMVNTDILPKLVVALDNVRLLGDAINYKDEIIKRYADDLKAIRIEVKKLQNRGE